MAASLPGTPTCTGWFTPGSINPYLQFTDEKAQVQEDHKAWEWWVTLLSPGLPLLFASCDRLAYVARLHTCLSPAFCLPLSSEKDDSSYPWEGGRAGINTPF